MKTIISDDALSGYVTKRWLSDRKRDYYYRKAKKEKLRSRAAYKLLQINDRFSIISPGDRVVDLGASPGGWSQVALELAGSTGKVVAADMRRMRPIEGVEFVLGDIRKGETVKAIIESLGGSADIVISDMSPNISGNYSTDHARSIELCEHALSFSRKVLRQRGTLLVKVFEGDLYREYLEHLKRYFKTVKAHGPKASRQASSEIYVIATGFFGDGPTEIA